MNKTIDKLNEIKTRLEDIKAKNTADIERYNDMITTAQEKLNLSNTELNEALKVSDHETFKKVLEEKTFNESTVNTLQKEIADIRQNPMISETEYKQIINETTAIMDDYMSAQKKEYLKQLENIFKLKQDIEIMIPLCNQIYSLAQKDIFKESPGVYTGDGTFVPLRSKEKKYTNLQLLDAMRETLCYTFNFEILSENHDRSEIIWWNDRGNWRK